MPGGPILQQLIVPPVARPGGCIYIACLSTANDLASQWNDYADQQRGFCITFDHLLLSSLWAPPGVRVMPVEYGEAVQRARTKRAVERAVADITELPYRGENEWQWGVHPRFTLLSVELLYFCASFKAERYRPEHELRLIYALQGDEAEALPVRTRGTGSAPIPYVELPLTRTYVGHPIPTFGRADPNAVALAQKVTPAGFHAGNALGTAGATRLTISLDVRRSVRRCPPLVLPTAHRVTRNAQQCSTSKTP